MPTMRRRPSPRRNRLGRPLSKKEAAVLVAFAIAVVAAMVVPLLLQLRSVRERYEWTKAVPWNPSWPALPALNVARGLRIEEARALYSFAGENADILKYIPCYCGCQSQGHRSNVDCYIGQRSA